MSERKLADYDYGSTSLRIGRISIDAIVLWRQAHICHIIPIQSHS